MDDGPGKSKNRVQTADYALDCGHEGLSVAHFFLDS